jgi:hypothetical protein
MRRTFGFDVQLDAGTRLGPYDIVPALGDGLWLPKNSISSNSGLAPGFLKTLAVPIRQNGASFIRHRERSSTVPVADRRVFPRVALGAGGWDWPVGVSGRLPFVPVMKPADLRDRHNATIDWRGDRARDRRVLVQRQVSA